MTKEKLTLGVLSIGIPNIQSGNTKYDWSIYDNPPNAETTIYLTDDNRLIYASKGSLEIGDTVNLVNHDSGRKVACCDGLTIIDSAAAEKETLVEMLYRNEFDYRKKRPFQKSKWKRKIQTSFSLKTINYNYKK